MLKNHKHLFRNAERLKPSTDLWQKIEAQVQVKSKTKMEPSSSLTLKSNMRPNLRPNSKPSQLWHEPLFRWAACLALVFGMVGTIGILREKYLETETSLIKADKTPVLDEDEDQAQVQDQDLLDPELLVWDADLGETEFLETSQIADDDSAEEIL